MTRKVLWKLKISPVLLGALYAEKKSCMKSNLSDLAVPLQRASAKTLNDVVRRFLTTTSVKD